ncbi:hypothetical protein RDV84_00165 [Lysobacter yananisis]|uniref:Globin n=1 Tax=Lysobacter yananisis TaxID=1003114 RepID=A0ABY9P8I2_9GAMM|nr:DUF6631 family protein [Lysobacter yananisis]WMT03304.1 hypothetical protein RDV84_00165 [Lysobacter yananisis]
MARKLNQPSKVAAEAAAAAAELQVLHPDRALPIADRMLVLREYGFFEGLQVSGLAKPFTDALFQLLKQSSEMPPVEDFVDVVGEHTEVVRHLVAWSATAQNDDPAEFARQVSETAAWINTLGESDGELLLLAWWGVNGPFFTRRLFRKRVEAESRLAGPGSTPP